MPDQPPAMSQPPGGTPRSPAPPTQAADPSGASAPSEIPGAAAGDPGGRVGLAGGERYRCNGCGNVTRFDVEVTERARRFWHADLAGSGRIESEERDTTVHEVRCRWCGSTDVAVEPAPASLGGTSPEDAGSA